MQKEHDHFRSQRKIEIVLPLSKNKNLFLQRFEEADFEAISKHVLIHQTIKP